MSETSTESGLKYEDITIGAGIKPGLLSNMNLECMGTGTFSTLAGGLDLDQIKPMRHLPGSLPGADHLVRRLLDRYCLVDDQVGRDSG